MQQPSTTAPPLTEYEAQRQRNIEWNQALLRELELNSPFAPPAPTTPKATKVARKPKLPSPGAVSAPSREKSARLANKAAGTKAPKIDPDALKISRSEDQPSSDDEDPSQATDADAPQVSTSIDFEYQATSELKDICTRFADGRVDDCLLAIITQANPDLAGEPGIALPPLDAASALGATPATNLPRVATEDPDGSAAVGAAVSLDPNVPTKRTKSKKKLTGQARKIAKAKRFGDVKVPVGTWHARRGDFHENLVHLPTMAGIFGEPEKGAYSIAVSGGYEDNVDHGESFTFTGEGGKIVDKRKKRGSLCKTKPNAPQTLTKGNMALYRSCQTGKPVRVIRGENSSWDGAPKEGYRYDGLYQVRKVWQQQGLSGFPVFQFALIRMAEQLPIDITAGPGSLLADQLAPKHSENLEIGESGSCQPFPAEA